MACGGEAAWASSLPQGVGWVILDKLGEPIERIPFRGVCKWWRVIAESYEELRRRNRQGFLPMLMVPMRKHRKRRTLYGIVAKKMYKIRLQVPYDYRCGGSSFGWMAFQQKKELNKRADNLAITLLKPFKNLTIKLPVMQLEREEKCRAQATIVKAILTADPILSPDGYVVVLIYSGFERLAFLKSGQKSWNKLDPTLTGFNDVIFYRNRVYALRFAEIIVVLDVGNQQPDTNIITPQKLGIKEQFLYDQLYLVEGLPYDQLYLVESSKGDLLLVERFYPNGHRSNRSFKVYKLLFDHQTGLITAKVEIQSLEGDALFLGDNNSMSIPASDFPGCQPNSIYYTDNYIAADAYKFSEDVGIFDVETGNVGKHYELKKFRRSPPVIWILPPVL